MTILKTYSNKLGLKHARLSFIPARVYDDTDSQNSADHVIKGELLPEFKKMVDSYLKAAIKQVKDGGDRFIKL